MINLLPFCDTTIADTMISAEVYSYFDKNIFNGIDRSKITVDDLIVIFSNRDLINNCCSNFTMSMNEFFIYIISYLKDEINLSKLTRSRKKIQQLREIINRIDDIP